MNWPFIRRAPAEQRIADLTLCLTAERACTAAVIEARNAETSRANTWAARHDAGFTQHRAERAEWTQRLDDMLDRYHALRVSGANPAPPIIPPAPRPEPDPVAQAMVEMAKGSPVLMKQFRDFVNEQRAGGVLDMEIAEKLRRGESDDEGVP